MTSWIREQQDQADVLADVLEGEAYRVIIPAAVLRASIDRDGAAFFSPDELDAMLRKMAKTTCASWCSTNG